MMSRQPRGVSQRSHEAVVSSAVTRRPKDTPSVISASARAAEPSRVSWQAAAVRAVKAQPVAARVPAAAQAPPTVSSATVRVSMWRMPPTPAASSVTTVSTTATGAAKGTRRPTPAARTASTSPSSSSARRSRQVRRTVIRPVHTSR